MKHLLVALLSFLSFTRAALGQEKNLYSASFQPEVTSYSRSHMAEGFSIYVRQVGATFTHTVYKNFSINVSYRHWKQARENGEISFSNLVGSLYQREKYQMADIGARYSLFFHNHNLFGVAAFSYAHGRNSYITSAYLYPGYDWQFFTTSKDESYYGASLQIGYNYFLFKKRVNVGASIGKRIYDNGFYQNDLNFNIGYHFNVFKRS